MHARNMQKNSLCKIFEILRDIALIGSPRRPRAVLFSDWVLFVLDETRDFVVRRNGKTGVFFEPMNIEEEK